MARRFNLVSGAVTDIGKVRAKNDDSYLADDERGVFAVADGMGGYRGGDVASALAVQVLEAAFGKQSAAEADAATPDTVATLLRGTLAQASRRIYEGGRTVPDLANMGTTMVVTSFVADQVVVAHVGDSRAYRIRDGALDRLTADHSLVAEAVRGGVLRSDQAKGHPMRNILTRCLGARPDVDVDVTTYPVEAGDLYVLCSDGLHGEIDDATLARLATASEPVAAAADLVAAANDHGGHDNITALVVKATLY